MQLFIFMLMASTCSMMAMATNSFINLDPLISTTSGQLVGQKTVINNAEVYQFLGVPYSQAPIGENRFEKPKELINASNNLIMAQQFKPTCIQMKHLAKAINPLLDVDRIHNISEDCLYLNIYVPVVDRDFSPLPVMVWLPGEGFDFADARQFNGAYLASMGRVIVITVQYRVGVFGFLKENAGLWDQLAALQWINQNAHSFGGNPEDITLFGRFTGSMSISILLSSPQVIDNPVSLFNRAILMSGIAVGNWVFDKKHDDKVQQFIESQGCTNFDCLKTMPAMKILGKSGYGWKPFVDSTMIYDEPLDAIRKGKFSKHVDSIMLGSNHFEGSLCLLKHLAMDETFYGHLIRNNVTKNDIEHIIREDLQMFYGDDYHFDNYKSGIITNRDNYLQFCSELLIDSHMREYEILLRKIYFNKNYKLRNIFKYKVDYKPSFSIAPNFINSSIHGDDVLLAFGLAFKSQLGKNENDQWISNRMVKLFSQFALNGLPQSDSDRYIDIRLESKQNSSIWTQNTLMVAISAFSIVFLIIFILKIRSWFVLIQNRSPSEHIKQLIQHC